MTHNVLPFDAAQFGLDAEAVKQFEAGLAGA